MSEVHSQIWWIELKLTQEQRIARYRPRLKADAPFLQPRRQCCRSLSVPCFWYKVGLSFGTKLLGSPKTDSGLAHPMGNAGAGEEREFRSRGPQGCPLFQHSSHKLNMLDISEDHDYSECGHRSDDVGPANEMVGESELGPCNARVSSDAHISCPPDHY
jgi:hypothetical protein